MARKNAAEFAEQVLLALASGEPRKAIAKRLGICNQTISNIVQQSGAALRHRRLLDPGEAQEMASQYMAGDSTCLIADRFQRATATVVAAIKSQGLAVRTSDMAHRRYSLNDHAFSDPTSSEEAAYWIGFLMADGCVSIPGRGSPRVSVLLAKKDEGHLEKLRKFLWSNHPIRTQPVPPSDFCGRPREAVSLHVHSSQIAADLARYGVVPRKTLTAEAFHLDHCRHFWRGVIDGDGTVGVVTSRYTAKRKCYLYIYISLVGSKRLVEQFRDYAKSLAPQLKARPYPVKTVWVFRATGSIAYHLVRLMYREATISLSRKQKIADRILSSL